MIKISEINSIIDNEKYKQKEKLENCFDNAIINAIKAEDNIAKLTLIKKESALFGYIKNDNYDLFFDNGFSEKINDQLLEELIFKYESSGYDIAVKRIFDDSDLYNCVREIIISFKL